MGTKERRDRAKHETRQMIMDAAHTLFSEVGFDAFTMRALASRIEYTPTAIYHHFANKDALVDELCRADFEHLSQHFQTLAHVADPVERMMGAGEVYLQFAVRHPKQYQFMFMTVRPKPVHSPEFIAERKGDPQQDAYTFLLHAVEESIRLHRLRPDYADAQEVSQMLWASLHGLISLHLSRAHDEWVEWRDLAGTARKLIRTLLGAIVREAQPVEMGGD